MLFGLGHLLVRSPAVVKGSDVISPADYAFGMNSSTVLAAYAALWACNHYFQSFGALSIVKVNARGSACASAAALPASSAR